jgi:hypothetical protein
MGALNKATSNVPKVPVASEQTRTNIDSAILAQQQLAEQLLVQQQAINDATLTYENSLKASSLEYDKRIAEHVKKEETETKFYESGYGNREDVAKDIETMVKGTPEQKDEARRRLRQASELSTDPFRDSGARRVMAALAAAFGSIASSINKTPNYALGVINDYIARDIEKQKANKDNAGKRLADLAAGRRLINDDDAREKYAAAKQYELSVGRAVGLISMFEKQATIPQTVANIGMMKETLIQERVKANQNAAGMLIQGAAQSADIEARIAVTEFNAREEARLKAAQDNVGQVSSYFTIDPSNPASQKTENMIKLTDTVSAAKNVHDMMSELKEGIERGDPQFVRSGRMNVLISTLLVEGKGEKMAALGAALTDKELELLKGSMGIDTIDGLQKYWRDRPDQAAAIGKKIDLIVDKVRGQIKGYDKSTFNEALFRKRASADYGKLQVAPPN